MGVLYGEMSGWVHVVYMWGREMGSLSIGMRAMAVCGGCKVQYICAGKLLEVSARLRYRVFSRNSAVSYNLLSR